MKDYNSHEYPSNIYNNMYNQIQYEMIESIKNAIESYDEIDFETKEDIINRIKQQIDKEKIQVKKMVELSNFQYNIRENRRKEHQENKRTRSYYMDYDYGFKLEYKDFLY